MKKNLFICILFTSLCIAPSKGAHAQVVLLVKAITEKVIKAIDLKIQRLQTKTIWLQNAQQGVQNEMHRLKLNDISSWAQKQQNLYKNYYSELWRVKSIISSYDRVKKIMLLEQSMVSDYHRAWTLVNRDKNFTPAELQYMSEVYTGMVGDGAKVIDQVALIVTSGKTDMPDQARLALIDDSFQELQQSLDDMHEFTNQNQLLSLQRGKANHQEDVVRSLYGL